VSERALCLKESGIRFCSADLSLELDRGNFAVMNVGELYRGRRCAVMWVFPRIQYTEIVT